jgi:hypothetical protein
MENMSNTTTLICDAVNWAHLLHSLARDFEPSLQSHPEMAQRAYEYVTCLQRSIERVEVVVAKTGLNQFIGHYSEPLATMAGECKPSWHELGLAVAKAVLRNVYVATGAADIDNRLQLVNELFGHAPLAPDLVRNNWPQAAKFLGKMMTDLDGDRLIAMVKDEGVRAGRNKEQPENLPPSNAVPSKPKYHERAPLPEGDELKFSQRGPLEGTLEELAQWLDTDSRNLRLRDGKNIWVQWIQRGMYRIWFESQKDFLAASNRKEQAEKDNKERERTLTRKLSKRRPR